MQITCPKCETSYEINQASLGPEGRKVRCIRCEHVWFASAPTSELLAAADAIGVTPAAETPGMAPPAESALESPDTAGGEKGEDTHAEPAAADATPDPSATDEPTTAPEDLDQALPPSAAEPVAIAEAPSIVPPDEQHDPLPAASNPLEPDSGDVGAALTRRARRILARKHRPPAKVGQIALAAALAASIGGLLLWRKEVVRIAPQTASLYAFLGMPVNLRGLSFDNIRTLREMHDGVPVLVVEGDIVSASTQTVAVPRLRFAVRNINGHEVYSWTAMAERSTLAPGDRMEFRSRLASPPADASDVVVRFFNRRDTIAKSH